MNTSLWIAFILLTPMLVVGFGILVLALGILIIEGYQACKQPNRIKEEFRSWRQQPWFWKRWHLVDRVYYLLIFSGCLGMIFLAIGMPVEDTVRWKEDVLVIYSEHPEKIKEALETGRLKIEAY